MPKPRIYHPFPLRSGDSVMLSAAASTHLTRVLRLETGAELTLFNGDGHDYAAVLASRDRDAARVTVGEASINQAEPGLQIDLLQGICRGQRMDFVIQKATELGVCSIRPVSCERSVVRLDGRRVERRQAHWQAVAISAAEQCGRASVPDIMLPQSPDAVLASLPQGGSLILLDPRADPGLGEVMVPDVPVALFCGPEGGLTDAERAAAERAGFRAVRLGPRVLRTETAPVAALAVIQFLCGDLNNTVNEGMQAARR